MSEMKRSAEAIAKAAVSFLVRRPAGIARFFVLGLFASRFASAHRLTSMAHVLAAIMQSMTSVSWAEKEVQGESAGRARNVAKTANGSAKTECASLISAAAAARRLVRLVGVLCWSGVSAVVAWCGG